MPEPASAASEVVISTAERLLQEGLAKGQARVLVRQLTLKFGPLPDEIQHRLANASTEQLDRWTDRVLTAADLQDVFA